MVVTVGQMGDTEGRIRATGTTITPITTAGITTTIITGGGTDGTTMVTPDNQVTICLMGASPLPLPPGSKKKIPPFQL